MKETGLMFKAPLVRAILDGSKIQTRRVFSEHMVKQMRAAAAMGEVSHFLDEGRLQPNDLAYVQQFSPVGQPGDRIYVRERFAQHPRFADLAYRAEGEEFEDSDGSLDSQMGTGNPHAQEACPHLAGNHRRARGAPAVHQPRGCHGRRMPVPQHGRRSRPAGMVCRGVAVHRRRMGGKPLGMADRLQAHRETAMTSASTVGLPEDKAYIAHHFNCPTCCAAGLSGGKQARCPAGQRLWDLYLQAFQALNLTPK